MKILFVAPTPFFADRGTHIRILEEALALEKLGHKITIATYYVGRDVSNEIETKIDIRRIRRLLFWYKKLEAGPDWQKIVLDLLLIRKVFFLARTQRPEIIHGHLHEGILIGWVVKKILFWRKIKLVADFHGSLAEEMISHGYLRGGFLKKLFRFIEKIVNNLGDFAIASSSENSNEIRDFRVDKNVETVLDGVNLDYYKNLPNKEILKRELELSMDKIILVYTGALIANKGTSHLFEAIKLVLEKDKNVFFLIAGSPAKETEKFIKKNNFGENVRLISPLCYFDLPRILSSCDAGIDPKDSSTHQASGKILQYMGAGLPVICFDRENNRQYLGENGVYIKNISAEGLADGIVDFIENKDKIKARGEHSINLAKNFSWDSSAYKIDKIYQNLMGK